MVILQAISEWLVLGIALLFFIILLYLILSAAIRIVPEYQRGVKFRLGRVVGVFGPGIVFLIPVIDRLTIVDLRVETLDIPAQKALTRDNVEVSVDAVVYLRVLDPLKVVLTVKNHVVASSLLAASTLRDVIGMVDLDTLLAHRDEVAKKIAGIVDEHVAPWGVKVVSVAIKDIRLPENMVRVIASQAEAERVRRAKIILAQAEYDASRLYLEASENYAKNNIAVLLRQIDALIEIARERNLILVVPSTLEISGLSASIAAALARRSSEGG